MFGNLLKIFFSISRIIWYYYGWSPPEGPGSSWLAKVAVGQQLGSRNSVWAAVGQRSSYPMKIVVSILKNFVQNLFGKVFADFIEFSLRSSWCRNVQKFSVEVFSDFSQKKACTDRRD